MRKFMIVGALVLGALALSSCEDPKCGNPDCAICYNDFVGKWKCKNDWNGSTYVTFSKDGKYRMTNEEFDVRGRYAYKATGPGDYVVTIYEDSILSPNGYVYTREMFVRDINSHIDGRTMEWTESYADECAIYHKIR